MEQKMDGQITSNFSSFSTVFQSYQDDGKVTMKDCMQWNPVYSSKGGNHNLGPKLRKYFHAQLS